MEGLFEVPWPELGAPSLTRSPWPVGGPERVFFHQLWESSISVLLEFDAIFRGGLVGFDVFKLGKRGTKGG